LAYIFIGISVVCPMTRCRLILVVFLASTLTVAGQGFEIVDKQDTYQAAVSENIQIPVRVRNNSDKAQFYLIRKSSDMASSQKGYFCLGRNCLEQGTDEFSSRIEPGETIDLYYTLETGLITGATNLRFEVFVRGNPQHVVEHAVAVQIEEKRETSFVFQSKDITIHDVYPNPVTDQAFIDYRIHNESIKAKVVIHNILGRTMNETELPVFETRIKLQAEELTTGIYFYTLYLDNGGVLTRKLIVRK
jgi:hypothetical protein